MTLLGHVAEDLYSVPLIFMCRAFTKWCSYIDGYRVALNPAQVEFTSNKYKGHRRIPVGFLNNLFKKSNYQNLCDHCIEYFFLDNFLAYLPNIVMECIA